MLLPRLARHAAVFIAAIASLTPAQDTREFARIWPAVALDSPDLKFDGVRFTVMTMPREGNFVPELRQRTNDAIERAIRDPDALWAFLTDPATPFADRGAAAYRGGHVFPPDHVPQLMRTLGELRAEERQHNFGLRPNPDPASPDAEVRAWWKAVLSHLQSWGEAERSRTILGHPWRVPKTVVAWQPAYSDIAESSAAPWPVQVKIVLEILLYAAAPKGDLSCPATAIAQGERWLDAALTLPCSTDDEAALFVEAASAGNHVTERVLARYRTIVLDPRCERSAKRILGQTSGISRTICAAPETVPQLQVLLLDALSSNRPESVRFAAAYSVPGLRNRWSGPKRPQSATLILALSQRGLEASSPSDSKRTSSEWNPLYAYLLSACEALDAPPFQPDRSSVTITLENASEWIARYREWFEAHRSELERAAAEEKPSLDAARARLIALEAR